MIKVLKGHYNSSLGDDAYIFFNAGMLYGMFNITECAVDEIGGIMISAVKSPISLPHT